MIGSGGNRGTRSQGPENRDGDRERVRGQGQGVGERGAEGEPGGQGGNRGREEGDGWGGGGLSPERRVRGQGKCGDKEGPGHRGKGPHLSHLLASQARLTLVYLPNISFFIWLCQASLVARRISTVTRGPP